MNMNECIQPKVFSIQNEYVADRLTQQTPQEHQPLGFSVLWTKTTTKL